MITPEHFRQQVESLAGAGLQGDGRLALAVSGGGDSLALLYLTARAFGARAHVLSVDHGLRAESAAECAMVARQAAEMGLPADILRLHMASGGNVQAVAREKRYAAMAARCAELHIRHLLTAHHADDQAETLLMRLARGSGLAGLCGIRPVAEIAGIVVLRPLLHHRRADLRAVTAAAGWKAAEDPSNDSPHYDRTRARRLLQHEGWLQPQRLAAAAAHLQQAEAALNWAEDRAWHSRAEIDDEGRLWLDCEALPQELRLRLLQRALHQFGARPDGPGLKAALAKLDAGIAATLGPCLLRPQAGRWQVTLAPPRRS